MAEGSKHDISPVTGSAAGMRAGAKKAESSVHVGHVAPGQRANTKQQEEEKETKFETWEAQGKTTRSKNMVDNY